MTGNTFELLGRRRFLPLFIAQFLGAANDNLFKNAIALLTIYVIGDTALGSAQFLTAIGPALFMLPFFLFSATAGELADRFEKSSLMKIVKSAEIAIAGLGGLGLYLKSVPVMLFAFFLLGMHSTFFGPLKYSVLPEYLAKNELIGGNALIEGGTFLAVLIGTIIAGVLILLPNGVPYVICLMLTCAASGFGASLFLPKAHPGNKTVAVRANPAAATLEILRAIAQPRDVYLSVLGISWLWAMGATFVTEFPAFAKDVLGADEHVVTLMLAMFSIGIGAGSLLCSRLLKGEISARYVPFAALGMALFSIDIFLASRQAHPPGALRDIGAFLADPGSWRILADLLLIAGCGGIYTVPLYAILQSRVPDSERARAIAGNNVVNAIFIVAASAVSAGLLVSGFTVSQIFLIIGIMNLGVAIYICGLLPRDVVRGVAAACLRLAYRVEVKGLENLKQAGGRTVIVANHISFLDAVLLAAFLPGDPFFAIDTYMARRWWVRPFLGLLEAFPLDPANPMSVRSLARKLREGGACVIFPEGRITRTGALMKVYEGPGLIANLADAAVVPVRIDGAQYTPFSRLKGKVRLRWFPKIALTVLPARRFAVPPSLVGRKRRQRVATALYDVLSTMLFETAHFERTLFDAFLDSRHIHGRDAAIIEDAERKPLGYGRLTTASLALGRALARRTRPGEYVGVLLPNAAATVVAFFALQAFGRIPAMLNFTTGAEGMIAACRSASVHTIVTSRRFIERARLEKTLEILAPHAEMLFLEDVKASLSLGDRFYGLAVAPFAARVYRRRGIAPSAPAVVLFTSGSEGTPKGVALSHANLLANCAQLAARIDFNAADTVFNALPLFHSFGLTAGLILPMLSGVKTFLYPSPLHYRIIPELAYEINATIFFGTNTFLAGYGRLAHPYDFSSVRYVFAGAEKVDDSTRDLFAEKFGLRILEGYGVTETAPVIACNTPMHFCAGTVGRFLPGIEWRLELVPGVAEGGRLLVRGPNVMLGYLRTERPGVIEPAPDGWHDTGDIVRVDEDGFVRIVGRVKRFAKIGGEMVSLARVEAEVAAVWPDRQHAVVALPDPRKGEQLIVVTTAPDATLDALLAHFRNRGLAELLVPKVILQVDRLPVLGSGKTDYPAVAKLALARH